MQSICGAKCETCPNYEKCPGCKATSGKPFGGDCVAAKTVEQVGAPGYADFKTALLSEINALLSSLNLPSAAALYELPGAYVNLSYPLPSGESVKFLDDRQIYLGTQIERKDNPRCIGVVANKDFILVSTYAENGASPKLELFKKR